MRTRGDIEKDVIKGAKLLDVCRPDWYTEIDTDKLNMKSLFNCILGQLWGEYWAGLSALGILYGMDYGFSDRIGDNWYWGLDCKEFWLEQIESRLAGEKVQIG